MTKAYIDRLSYILKSNNVKLDSFNSKYIRYDESKKNLLWIKDIFIQTDLYLENLRKQLEKKTNNFFVSQIFNDSIEKYFCLFPSNSIVTNGIFYHDNQSCNKEYYEIPVDFLKMIINNKEMIELGIYTVVPESIRENGDGDSGSCYVNTIEYFDIPGCAVYKSNIISENAIYIEQNMVDKVYFLFPWLYGASAKDYLDIVYKNETLFKKYEIEVGKFVKMIREGKIENVLEIMKEMHIDMQIEFENAQNQLKRKGINTIMGIMITFVPLLLPNLDQETKLEVSSLLGATNLLNISTSLTEQIEKIKLVGRNNPLWINWKWKEISEKRK